MWEILSYLIIYYLLAYIFNLVEQIKELEEKIKSR